MRLTPVPRIKAELLNVTVAVPVPLVPRVLDQPTAASFTALDRNRYLVGVTTQLHQGATIQATNPIPPISQPLFNYYKPDINRYLWEGPEQLTDGATRQQTYIFPPNQPELNAFESVKNRNRFIVDVTKSFTGATIQQTYIFPLAQPRREFEFRSQLDAIRYFDGATNQQTYIFYPNQPEFRRYTLFDPNRAPQSGPVSQFTGTTTQQTYIFPVGQPRREFEFRSPLDAVKFFDGATSQQTYIFYPNQPELRRYNLFDPNRAPQSGPVSQFTGVTNQQTYIFPVSQPRRELGYISPFEVGPTKQFLGAGVIQPQTYIFYPSQPRREFEFRSPIDATKYFDGATNQQTYVFPVNQPRRELGYINPLGFGPAPQLNGTGVITPQTYVFFPNQPELRSYTDKLNWGRFAVAVVNYFEGSTKQQTYVFQPNQPSEYRYYTIDVNRLLLHTYFDLGAGAAIINILLGKHIQTAAHSTTPDTIVVAIRNVKGKIYELSTNNFGISADS